MHITLTSPTESFVEIGKKYHEQYKNADPFPHIVLDNVFDEETLSAVLDEFPSKDNAAWNTRNAVTEKKSGLKNPDAWGSQTRDFISNLNSRGFLRFLEELSGIEGLIPDPHFEGGGLHELHPGGHLAIHADFNWHQELKLDRRLNALVYLNKNWKEEYNGHLELWDRTMSNCVQKVLPVFNRMVIFSTTDFSYHGNPEPVACEEGNSRKSLALYYYTNGRPAGEGTGSHTTLFKRRKGEKRSLTLHEVATQLMPPIVFDFVDRVRRNRSQK